MAVTTTKPAYTVRWKDDENERNLRKLFFAAAAAIPDQMLSNLAQTLVRIALKLLELLRAHRAAYGGRAYAPPTDAAQDVWMTTDSDLVETVEELESEFHTQYVKDKIDATTGAGGQGRYILLRTINTLMRDGLLETVKDKTLLSHLKNKTEDGNPWVGDSHGRSARGRGRSKGYAHDSIRRRCLFRVTVKRVYLN
jgi:hypothetical protein